MKPWKEDNTLIRYLEAKPSSGTYEKTLGAPIGKAMSTLHSEITKSGNALEEIIADKSKLTPIQDKDEMNLDSLMQKADGRYRLSKMGFFESNLCKRKGQGEERGFQPDIILLDKKGNSLAFSFIELKLGYDINTHTAAGKREGMNSQTRHLISLEDSYNRNRPNIGITCKYYFCSWNCDNKDLINKGTKYIFNTECILSAEELCDEMNMNQSEIEKEMAKRTAGLKNTFINMLLEDEEVLSLALDSMLNNPIIINRIKADKRFINLGN